MERIFLEDAVSAAKGLAERYYKGEIEVSINKYGQNCLIVPISDAFTDFPDSDAAREEALDEIITTFYDHLRDIGGECICPKRRSADYDNGNLIITLGGCCGHCTES